MERRHFFKISILSSGSLLLSNCILQSCSTTTKLTEWNPNFFIRIDTDNIVTFLCCISEIGQGSSTGLAMIMADELGANFDDVKIELADASGEKYSFLQATGGSNGIRMLWKPLRHAAATVREILIKSASIKLNVSESFLYTDSSFVHNSKTKEKVSFGSLLKIASELTAPIEIKEKSPSDFKYIGKSIPGKHTINASKGTIPYSININFPNMLYAVIERCPVWEGRLISFNDESARSVKGVVDVIEVKATDVQNNDFRGGVRPGIAVIATNTWAAIQGRKKLKIKWDLGDKTSLSHITVHNDLTEYRKNNKKVIEDIKSSTEILNKSVNTYHSRYDSSYQVNACMEPLNAVAFHYGYKVQIWAGTQAPSLLRERVAELTDLPVASIEVNNQPAGGGFGRRFFTDFVEEAVIISGKLRKPVKVMWTREDTFQTSKYHPYCSEFWEAALDKDNFPRALGYQGFTSGINGFRPFPYGLPISYHSRMNYKNGKLLPRAAWRSVFAHPWALGLESFIDELAHIAQRDSLEFRLELLNKAEIVKQKQEPWVGDDLYPKKLAKTLEKVAEVSDWFSKKDGNTFQGCSSVGYNTSYCSMVVNLKENNQGFYVSKVFVVIDCGTVINPSKVTGQVEGSVAWGLTALKTSITVNDGQVEQRNFDSYPLLTIHEMPKIEVRIIISDDVPTGSGEPAVPCVAPAVLNAFFKATGKRIKSIPFSLKTV